MRQIALYFTVFSCVILQACSIKEYNPTNIIDITDEQYLENSHGERCKEAEMLITPDEIRYFYPDCGVTRVVKPKPHIIPKPLQPKQCKDRFSCSL